MARPKKKGLEYFPMDVTMFNDVKIRRLLRKSGTDAIAVYIQLLTEIYKQGYWLATDEDTAFLVGEQIGMEECDVKDIMEACVKVGLFNADIYAQDGVLTSRGIQERYQAICRQCGRACDIAEYALISSEETPVISEETIVNSEETPINSEETPVSCLKSTQSKVKKRKENKKESVCKEKAATASVSFRPPTHTQVEDFAKESGLCIDVDAFIDYNAARGWMIGSNAMADWRAAARKWAHMGRDKPKPKVPEVPRMATAEEARAEQAAKAEEERRRVTGIYERAKKGNARMAAIVAGWAENGTLERYGLKPLEK